MNVSFNIQPYLPFISKINILLNFTRSNLSASVMGPHLVAAIAVNRPQAHLCQLSIRVQTTKV